MTVEQDKIEMEKREKDRREWMTIQTEKYAKEKAEREEIEAKEQAEAEAVELARQEELKPDKVKLLVFAKALTLIQCDPEPTQKKARDILKQTYADIDRVVDDLKSNIESI